MTEYHFDGEYFPIPQAPLYVLSNDGFIGGLMSEGGSFGRRVTNTCVIPCYSQQEADAVYNYALSRGDQKHIRINETAPRDKPNVVYSLVLGWVPRALERLHNGNERAIIHDHYVTARKLTDDELREAAGIAFLKHHTCAACFFCVCKAELERRAG